MKPTKTEKDMLKFWNDPDLKELKRKIVNPDMWESEIPVHLALLFDTPVLGEVRDPGTIVEIGCGIGRLLKPLSSGVHGENKVIGLDISDRMLEEAKVYLKEVHPSLYELHKLELDGKFPLEDNSVDLVYSIMVFQHIHDRKVIKKYIREAKRVLKPGGYLRVQTHKGIPSKDGKFHGFAGQMYESLDKFVQEFKSAGLSVVESTHGDGYKHWLWVTARK